MASVEQGRAQEQEPLLSKSEAGEASIPKKPVLNVTGTACVEAADQVEEAVSANQPGSEEFSAFDKGRVILGDAIDKHAPQLRSFYNENLKEKVEPALANFQCTSSSVIKDYIRPNLDHIHVVHGVMLALYGGCYTTIALCIAFWSTFGVQGICFEAAALYMKATGAQDKVSDAEIQSPAAGGNANKKSGVSPDKVEKFLGKLGILLLAAYACWSSDLVCSVVVALTLSKYVTPHLVNVQRDFVGDLVPENISQWVPLLASLAVKLVFTITGYFMPVFQGTLLIALHGAAKVSGGSAFLKEKLASIKFAKKDGKLTAEPVFAWGLALLGALFQALWGYQASILKFFVPLGFFLPSNKQQANLKSQ